MLLSWQKTVELKLNTHPCLRKYTVKKINLIQIGCLEFRIKLLVFRTFLLIKYMLQNVFRNNFLKSSTFNLENSTSFLNSRKIWNILRILSKEKSAAEK